MCDIGWPKEKFFKRHVVLHFIIISNAKQTLYQVNQYLKILLFSFYNKKHLKILI